MGTVSSYRHVLHQTMAAHLQNHCRECGNRRTWLGLGIWVNNHMQELVWVCFKKHVDFSVFSHTPCYSFRATWSRTEFPNWEIRPSDKPRRYKNVKEQWKTLKNGCKKLESELRTGSSSDRSAQLIFLHVLKIHHICMAKSFMFQVTLKENSSTIHSSRPLECETLAMGAHLLLTVISHCSNPTKLEPKTVQWCPMSHAWNQGWRCWLDGFRQGWTHVLHELQPSST